MLKTAVGTSVSLSSTPASCSILRWVAISRQSGLRRSEIATTSKCQLPGPRSFSSSSRSLQSDDKGDLQKDESLQDKETSSSDSPILNPVFRHSKASLRPLPNARSPLFSKQPLIASSSSSSSEVPEVANESSSIQIYSPSRERDPTLRSLYQTLTSQSRDASKSKFQTVVQTCNEIAVYMKENNLKPTYIPYYALLANLEARAMIDEAWTVLDDMEQAGLPRTLMALNYILQCAVTAGDAESVENVCEMINNLPTSTSTQATANKAPLKKSAQLSASYQPPSSLGPGIAIDITGFNSMTYLQLFRFYLAEQRLEDALLLFSSLVSSRHTSVAAFMTYMRPQSVEYLITLLCDCQELRLATEIAQWLHLEGTRRLVSPKVWMQVGRACAIGNYHPGLKTAWQETVAKDSVVPDEGFLLAALATASRAPDSELCLNIIECFLRYSSNWCQLADSITMGDEVTPPQPPPLQHNHLVPLLEAFAAEGKYKEMMRLAGAMNYWGIELNQHCFDILALRSSRSQQELANAISEWQRVIDEGAQTGQDSSESGSTSASASPTPPQTKAEIIARVSSGKLKSLQGLVETHTMNALIQSAANLGETDEALNIWEERRYVKNYLIPLPIQRKQQQEASDQKSKSSMSTTLHTMGGNPQGKYIPLSPTQETFNSLLTAALNRNPPSPNLAVSIYREMRSNFSTILPNQSTFELLIQIHLSSSSTSTLQSDQKAYEYFEECKEFHLLPSRKSYDLLIRSSLKRNKDIRWIELTREMAEEAKYKVPFALGLTIKQEEEKRREKGQLKMYSEGIWHKYVDGNQEGAS
ncbi:unnamed protein product [Sympodiomycopsis kandeliae]